MEEILITVTSAVVMAVISAAVSDNRAFRKPARRKISSRITQWYYVSKHIEYFDGWFVDRLRCSKASFKNIASTISTNWLKVNQNIHWNTVFRIEDQLAFTIHYFAHVPEFSA
ncbi:hypothetical protein ROZALSC1DRAFT_25423 [Rozella allomycis CSF55]|uniref:Uncharacterized protein n=1 Tax=Rozella allomycis (strain CSF55) TaxID=988480 RepID=A0A4P9YDN4_ROZAC|nr:hypothetical protein ROZALSC1DRAFT_25423 [Rozella allomycis CSF55]